MQSPRQPGLSLFHPVKPSVPGTTTESIDGELIFKFASPPQLVAGIEYALVLRSLYSQTLQWAYSSLNTYGGGVRLDFVDPVGWQRVPTEDYAFTTVMVASADPRFEVLADSNNDGIGDELMFGNRSGDPEIRWRKETKTGLLGGVTFALTRTHSYDVNDETFTDIVDEVMVVTDNLPPDSNPIAGLFTVSGLQFGIYTLQETVPVPGYDPDPFVQTFILTNTDPNQDSPHIFFNTWAKRAFIGSTMLLRQEYLAQIELADATLDGGYQTALIAPVTETLATRAVVTPSVVTQTTVQQVQVTPSPVIQQSSVQSQVKPTTSVQPVPTQTQNQTAEVQAQQVTTAPAASSAAQPVSSSFGRRSLIASGHSNRTPSLSTMPAVVTPMKEVASETVVAEPVVVAAVVEPPKTTNQPAPTVEPVVQSQSAATIGTVETESVQPVVATTRLVASNASAVAVGQLRRVLGSGSLYVAKAAAIDQVIFGVANEIATIEPVVMNPSGHSGQQMVLSTPSRSASFGSDTSDDKQETLDLLYGFIGKTTF